VHHNIKKDGRKTSQIDIVQLCAIIIFIQHLIVNYSQIQLKNE